MYDAPQPSEQLDALGLTPAERRSWTAPLLAVLAMSAPVAAADWIHHGGDPGLIGAGILVVLAVYSLFRGALWFATMCEIGCTIGVVVAFVLEALHLWP